MYKCEGCGEVIPTESLIRRTDESGERLLCPVCECDALERVHKCPECGEYTPDDYCGACKARLYKDVQFAIEDLKARWGDDLIRETIVEYMEEVICQT